MASKVAVAAPPAKKEFDIEDIRDPEKIKQEIASPQLKVVEVYSEWAGPCKALVATLKFVYFDLDKADQRLRYFRTLNSLLPDVPPEAASKLSSSKPIYLFYKNGALLDVAVGPNSPLVTKLIAQLVPSVDGLGKPNAPLPPEARTRLSALGLVPPPPSAAEAINQALPNLRRSFYGGGMQAAAASAAAALAAS
eukprot:tig00020614_g12128.t1